MKIYTNTNTIQILEIFDWLDRNGIDYGHEFIPNIAQNFGDEWVFKNEEDATLFALIWSKYRSRES